MLKREHTYSSALTNGFLQGVLLNALVLALTNLGIDFVKEQPLAIDASGPHFTEAARLLPDNICPLFTQTEVCVPPWTVKRLTVNPRATSGLKCPPGTTGVVSSDTDEYGIWDAATTVQDDSSCLLYTSPSPRDS